MSSIGDNGDLGCGLGAVLGSGDLTSPAPSIAACSSARVGSLIGAFTFGVVGDNDADCFPHKDVAFFTEANVLLSGERSSLAGVNSTLGGGISFKATGFGVSATGGEGNARENLEVPGFADGRGDAGFISPAGCVRGDFCGVLKFPETLLSDSSEVGFFGIPGDAIRGDDVGSGRVDCLGVS